ncbi:MAG: O-antigen ligase family protein [Prochlorococcus marinus CUG1436]|nr:O-antigen ligase family protein [Prochlorococcus marinus CUG1436]
MFKGLLEKLNLNKDFGKLSFLTGIFLLPSAFSLSILFFLFSLVISLQRNKNSYFADKYNFSFFMGGLFLIISAIFHSLGINLSQQYSWDSNLSWIGLANWLPFFLCFYGFQSFLNTPNERKAASLTFLYGTFPVIISGLGQAFFNWNGPLKTLGGLIIWYQRPIENFTELTALFNNPNYAGLWLNLVWPFCLACIIVNKKVNIGKIASISFGFGIAITTILTNSRSAWFGLFITIFLTYGKRIINIIPKLFFGFFFILITSLIPLINKFYEIFFKIIIPNQSWISVDQNHITRIDIWVSALNNIISNPLFGSGSGSFSEIFMSETGVFKGHPHNLSLELILSYGIPAAILIITPIAVISFLSFRKIFLETNHAISNSIFEKSWIISLVILIASQMVDVQYFDGRISLFLWILLAGSRNIIRNDMKLKI